MPLPGRTHSFFGRKLSILLDSNTVTSLSDSDISKDVISLHGYILGDIQFNSVMGLRVH